MSNELHKPCETWYSIGIESVVTIIYIILLRIPFPTYRMMLNKLINFQVVLLPQIKNEEKSAQCGRQTEILKCIHKKVRIFLGFLTSISTGMMTEFRKWFLHQFQKKSVHFSRIDSRRYYLLNSEKITQTSDILPSPSTPLTDEPPVMMSSQEILTLFPQSYMLYFPSYPHTVYVLTHVHI